MCLFFKRNEQTLAELEYEQAMLQEGTLGGEELRLHRGRMIEMAKNIKELREEVESLLKTTTH